ncbi:MAG TPA: hypothetical protein VMU84_21430, partial [Thermoanaerobaculia bacterium]|nr:hypothetical protein [Thermoanaerobaculia bacterium]
MTFGTKAVDNRSAMRMLVLALILAALFGMKLAYLPGTGPYSLDGSFYVNAARNVEEGVGLKTNVSMYHRGNLVLPTRSRLIYPLWPLLLGYTGRAIGLVRAINVLTPLFYLIDLILLYVVVRRLQERMWGPANEIF